MILCKLFSIGKPILKRYCFSLILWSKFLKYWYKFLPNHQVLTFSTQIPLNSHLGLNGQNQRFVWPKPISSMFNIPKTFHNIFFSDQSSFPIKQPWWPEVPNHLETGSTSLSWKMAEKRMPPLVLNTIGN